MALDLAVFQNGGDQVHLGLRAEIGLEAAVPMPDPGVLAPHRILWSLRENTPTFFLDLLPMKRSSNRRQEDEIWRREGMLAGSPVFFHKYIQIGVAVISLLNNSKFDVSDPDYRLGINRVNGIGEYVTARRDQEWVILDDTWWAVAHRYTGA